MTVIISQIKDSEYRVEGLVQVNNRRFPIYFSSRSELSALGANALMVVALPAAMKLGVPMIVEGEVSARLLSNMTAVQNLFKRWDQSLRIVDIQANKQDSIPERSSERALCFTGGVDSFYSAIKTPEAALFYAHGLDLPLKNTKLRVQVSKRLSAAAEEFGRPFFEMETNLRSLSDIYFPWNLAFGGALSACGTLLSGHFGHLGIAAGRELGNEIPDGGEPTLTQNFSSDGLQVATIGSDASRFEKIRLIAGHQAAQNYLRVCWENRGGAYNCGVCEKCLRTMASLEIVGHLDRFGTFDTKLDYARLSRAVPAHAELDVFTTENLTAAQKEGANPDLISSLKLSLDPSRSQRIRFLRKWIPRRAMGWHYRFCKFTGII